MIKLLLTNLTAFLLLPFMAVTASASMLKVQMVTDGVYAIVGPSEQRNEENLANNATFGVIVTDEGIVLVDAGGSWKGAEELHAVIKTISDKPVKYVVNTGGQDHRWLGNGYWKTQGATIIASNDAVEDQKERGSVELSGLSILLKDKLQGTEPVYADITFDDLYDLEIGGIKLQITHHGQAHTPGDSFVWLDSKKTVFTGDIVFVGRILGVREPSNAKSWIESFEAMAALNPEHLVPGHGPATDLAKAKADTYDYLKNLRTKMAEYIDNGGDIIGSVNVDQSAFKYLKQFDMLAKRNAQKVFSEMEWE